MRDNSTGRTTPRGWAIARLWRRTAHGFGRGWRALTPLAWRRWLATIVVGFALVSVLTAGLTWAVRALAAAGLLSWETAVLRWLEGRVPFYVAVWMAIPGSSVVLWPVVGFAAGWAARAGRPLRALGLIVGYALIKALVIIGWTLWDRDRPTVIRDGLMSPGGFFDAFPSAHAAQALVAYGLLAAFWIRKSGNRAERVLAVFIVLLVDLAVSVGRLRVGAHWPTDVMGGAVIGGAWLAVIVIALRWADAERRRWAVIAPTEGPPAAGSTGPLGRPPPRRYRRRSGRRPCR